MSKIIMILLFFTSFNTFGQNVKNQLLQFDGLYKTECEFEDDEEGTQSYLRFYSNGKVLSVSTDCEGPDSDLKDWFYLEAGKGGIGNYQIKRHKMKFSTISETGTVNYRGRINKYGFIKLRSKSLVNGYKGHEKYKFIKIMDLK